MAGELGMRRAALNRELAARDRGMAAAAETAARRRYYELKAAEHERLALAHEEKGS